MLKKILLGLRTGQFIIITAIAFTLVLAGCENPTEPAKTGTENNTGTESNAEDEGGTGTEEDEKGSGAEDEGDTEAEEIGDEDETTEAAILIDDHDTVLTLPVGGTYTLTAKITPENTANATITWGSDNEKVATVDEKGVIRGIAVGLATITATTEDSGKASSRNVTVTYPVSSIRIVALPTKTNYYLGEELDLKGLKVEATYLNGDPAELVTIGPPQVSGFENVTDMVGDKAVTLTVTYGNKTDKRDYPVSVWYKITDIVISPAQQHVVAGDTVNFHAVVKAASGTPPQGVTWSIDGATDGITTDGSTIDEKTGVLTIGESETVNLTVRATSTYINDNNKKESRTAPVTITAVASITKVDITDEASWNKAFADMETGAVNSINVYELNIKENFEVAGIGGQSEEAFNATNTISKYIEVRLTGNKEIALNSNSSSNSSGSIIRTGATQTYIIDGPTLKGGNGNTEAVVLVTKDSMVELRRGTISGNTMSSFSGAGVYVTGTFTMNNGTISGNSAYDGGGVFVAISTARFTMNGGTISGNSAKTYGGGVLVSKGTFTMNGGTISGNSAINTGGGVDVTNDSTFTMKGGIIYGKNEPDVSLRNTAKSAAALYVYLDNKKSINDTITSYP
jgi:hypothetical protein